MLLRELGLLFVHIPKCAGSSVEQIFMPGWGSETTDYERLMGWCPDRKIWMQHATLQQLVDTGLISESALNDLTVVSIVRNPFERAVSDYHHLRTRIRGITTFTGYLKQRGQWHSLLNDSSTPAYRGDHVTPQVEFLMYDGQLRVDLLGRLEDLSNFRNMLADLLANRGYSLANEIPRLGVGSYHRAHYSEWYTDSDKKIVAERYRADIATFQYGFSDQASRLDPLLLRMRTNGAEIRDLARRLFAKVDKCLPTSMMSCSFGGEQTWRCDSRPSVDWTFPACPSRSADPHNDR